MGRTSSGRAGWNSVYRATPPVGQLVLQLRPFPQRRGHAYYGFGRVDAFAAVSAAYEEPAPGDTQAPAVSIFSPDAGATVSDLVAVEVSASDDHGVTEVTLYANGQLVGTDTTAPYQFSWDSTQEQDGGATLTAYAYDAAGNEGISADVQVTVENSPATDDADTIAPTVKILSPSDGSTVRHKVQIWVSAQDDVSLASIQLSIDGQQVSSSASRNLVYEWNTRPESDGGHTIEAVAEDASGNVSRQTIQVTVKNSNGRWK